MTESTVYDYTVVSVTKPLLAVLTLIKSDTFYKGNKSEEKSNYTNTYKPNGIDIDTVTTYYYHISGNDYAGAVDANSDSYMTKSVTKRFSDDSTKQISYYTGTEAGQESIDWSQEYNFDGSAVKTTTV